MKTDRETEKYSEKTLPQCHFLNYKFHIKCPGIELGVSAVRNRLLTSLVVNLHTLTALSRHNYVIVAVHKTRIS
jgi:hypothetical protein